MFWRGRHCGSWGKPEQLRPLCYDDLLPRAATRCQCGVAGELSALLWWEWEEWEHWNILQVYAKPGRCGSRSCARISLPLPLRVCLSYCQSCKFLSLAAVMLLVHRCAFFISYLCGSPCVLSCTITIRKYVGFFFVRVCISLNVWGSQTPPVSSMFHWCYDRGLFIINLLLYAMYSTSLFTALVSRQLFCTIIRQHLRITAHTHTHTHTHALYMSASSYPGRISARLTFHILNFVPLPWEIPFIRLSTPVFTHTRD